MSGDKPMVPVVPNLSASLRHLPKYRRARLEETTISAGTGQGGVDRDWMSRGAWFERSGSTRSISETTRKDCEIRIRKRYTRCTEQPGHQTDT